MMLELKEIRKLYHSKAALQGIDLCIRAGDSVTFFGPNGAGKTTLMKIMSGIMSPTEGKVLFNAKRLSESNIRREIFYLGHKNSLYNALTVKENIDFVSRIFRRSNGEAPVDDILREHGFWERRNDPVRELSQGMKRRLALAKCFLMDPKIVILDEPFTGLDLRWRNFILSRVKELKKTGASLILTTHLVEEGYEVADYVGFLHKGRLLLLKKKDEVSIEEVYDLFNSIETEGK
jgi:heme ABC exporter ATP-binding subunit CcmA